MNELEVVAGSFLDAVAGVLHVLMITIAIFNIALLGLIIWMVCRVIIYKRMSKRGTNEETQK